MCKPQHLLPNSSKNKGFDDVLDPKVVDLAMGLSSSRTCRSINHMSRVVSPQRLVEPTVVSELIMLMPYAGRIKMRRNRHGPRWLAFDAGDIRMPCITLSCLFDGWITTEESTSIWTVMLSRTAKMNRPFNSTGRYISRELSKLLGEHISQIRDHDQYYSTSIWIDSACRKGLPSLSADMPSSRHTRNYDIPSRSSNKSQDSGKLQTDLFFPLANALTLAGTALFLLLPHAYILCSHACPTLPLLHTRLISCLLYPLTASSPCIHRQHAYRGDY